MAAMGMGAVRGVGLKAPSLGGSSDAAAFRANFVGPTFGRSGFISSTEFAEASYLRYQGFVNDAYTSASAAEARGALRGNPNTRVGTAVDRESALRFGNWLVHEGIAEGPGAMIQANRWLRDPTGSGLYVRPDLRIPGASVSLDATVGMKWSTDTQITRFSTYSIGDRITIVRPQQLGGSYSIWP